jgi:hypothetical protein
MGDPKKVSNLRRCEKRLGGGPLGLCRQGFDPPPLCRIKWELISFETFTPGFRSMAGPAQAFEVRIIIGTPMSLSLDVVNGLSCDSSPAAQAVLAQMVVTLQDARTLDIPLATIATLVPTLSLLMLLPAFIAVLLAVA